MENSASIRPDGSVEPILRFEELGDRTGERISDKEVVVEHERGRLRWSLINEHTCRMQLVRDGQWPTSTQAVGNEVESATWQAVYKNNDNIALEGFAQNISIHANGDTTFAHVANLRVLSGDNGAIQLHVSRSPRDRFYGLGEETGFLDKRHDRYQMWNSDIFAAHAPDFESLYQSIPFIIHMTPEGKAYGIFVDNPGRVIFDMRASENEWIVTASTTGLDVYVFSGPSVKDVVTQYIGLTGRMPMPPKWALGYHQSRYSYQTEEEVRHLAKTFREKNIGCDVIHLDIHYMNGYRVFTFDPGRFPNPAKLVADLKQEGFHIVPIVDPGVKQDREYSVYQQGIQGNYFCQYPDSHEVFIGDVWPGPAVFPDFSQNEVAAWWGENHRFYTDMGIEGIWNDMNEPSVFNDIKTMPDEVIHRNNGEPVSHGTVHNLFGMWMSKATSEGLLKLLNGKRPFVLTRSGFAGIQRYAAVWTGDNRSYWEHMAMAMPMVMNLGLSGVAFAGTDIGGFAHDVTGELLARWTQLGAFFPFARNHSELQTRHQEPWQFGEEIEDICRHYINLRYALMPYIYSVFYQASATGAPVMRPLVWDYSTDPATHNLSDQFLVGESLLVAPVYRPDTERRLVYLPAGHWYDYWTGENHAGEQYIVASAPLDTLPIFVKEGAVIPRQDPVAHTGIVPNTLHFDFYPLQSSEGSQFAYYEDDGETTGYQAGHYNLIDWEWRREPSGAHHLTITPARLGYQDGPKLWEIHLRYLAVNLNVADLPQLSRSEWDTGERGWIGDDRGTHLRIAAPNSPVTVHCVR